MFLIIYLYFALSLVLYTEIKQFQMQSLLINRFKQSPIKFCMYRHCCTNYLIYSALVFREISYHKN